MTATLQRMVRDPRTGEVHMPREPLSIIRTMENLGRTLIKIKWQAGGESVLLPDDIDSYDDEGADGGDTRSRAGLLRSNGHGPLPRDAAGVRSLRKPAGNRKRRLGEHLG